MDRKDSVIGRWLIVAFELEWNGWIMGGMMIASAMEHVSCASVGLVLSPLCAFEQSRVTASRPRATQADSEVSRLDLH